jgi:hypothetical protein
VHTKAPIDSTLTEAAFINSAVENCGVYQYGKRLAEIVQQGHRSLYYAEFGEVTEFRESIAALPQIILFNYIAAGRPTAPLAWLTDALLDELREGGHIVGTIGHLKDVRLRFDFVVTQDPTCDESERLFALPRPLPHPGPKFAHRPAPAGQPVIGSFGFAAPTKRYPLIVELVVEQFRRARIVLNINNANYHDPDGVMRDQIIADCYAVPRPGAIELEITSNMLSDQALLEFLAGCDLCVFPYEEIGTADGGVASVVDYAVAAGAPVAISQSAMFRHIYADSICYAKRTLPEIIESGPSWIRSYQEAWSHHNCHRRYWEIMDSVKGIGNSCDCGDRAGPHGC